MVPSSRYLSISLMVGNGAHNDNETSIEEREKRVVKRFQRRRRRRWWWWWFGSYLSRFPRVRNRRERRKNLFPYRRRMGNQREHRKRNNNKNVLDIFVKNEANGWRAELRVTQDLTPYRITVVSAQTKEEKVRNKLIQSRQYRSERRIGEKQEPIIGQRQESLDRCLKSMATSDRMSIAASQCNRMGLYTAVM